MRFALKFILEKAKCRPDGYVEDCLACGRIVGDEIEFEDKDYAALCGKYRPRGAGDVLAWLIKRFGIAKAVKIVENLTGLPCDCEDRIAWLNERFPADAGGLQEDGKEAESSQTSGTS